MVRLRGGVTAPMRARRAAVGALSRLHNCKPWHRDAVADVVSELVTEAVRHGGAANVDHTLEVVLECRDDALRVEVHDDSAPEGALEATPCRLARARARAVGADDRGAWAELALA